MKVVIARHGETDWNAGNRLMGRIDVHLNENGRKQAEILKEELKDFDFDICFSSPLSRAKETAEIVCDGKCEVVCDTDLAERYAGELEGKVINNWGDYMNNKTVETDAEILNRAKNFFEKLKESDYQTVLVVSHNGLLKNLQYYLLGKTGELDYLENNLKNCEYKIFEI